jgi:hypothetical protein
MGVFFAWMIGESVIFWRWGKLGAPPTPGVLAMSSGLFAAAAVVSAYQPARTLATVAAFGVDLAVLLQVVGKAPSAVTGWPPPMISDPAAILPNGANAPAAAGSGTSTAPVKLPPAFTPDSNPPPGIARKIWGTIF